MLRHYDGLGLVRPSGRTASGYRDYSDDDVQRLFQVEALRSIGLPLSQIGRALESPGAASDAAVAELKRAARLRAAQALELLDKLTAIEEGGPTRWEEVLRAIELMKELDSRSGARRQQRVLTQSFEDAIPVGILVRALVSEEDPHVAGALRWAIARLGASGLAALVELLEEPATTRPSRIRLAQALVEIGTPAAREALAALSGDPDPQVVGIAAVLVERDPGQSG